MDGQAVIGATVGDPWMYVAIVAMGILAFGLRLFIKALIDGGLRTGSEAAQKDKRIEYLETALDEAHSQSSKALAVLPEIAGVLAELHPSKAVDPS